MKKITVGVLAFALSVNIASAFSLFGENKLDKYKCTDSEVLQAGYIATVLRYKYWNKKGLKGTMENYGNKYEELSFETLNKEKDAYYDKHKDLTRKNFEDFNEKNVKGCRKTSMGRPISFAIILDKNGKAFACSGRTYTYKEFEKKQEAKGCIEIKNWLDD